VGQKQFELKQAGWKTELAEAQRLHKQRQDDTGLTTFQHAETAAFSTAARAWEMLLVSRPTTLAGALAFTRYIIECHEIDRTEQGKTEAEYAFRALLTVEASLSAASLA
jgi:hypothetical protein